MENSEVEVLEGLLTKDIGTRERFVRNHTRPLLYTCLGIGFSETDAEDIVQTTWITFFDSILNFERRSSLKTYLFGILYHKASEHRKKMQKADPVENIEEILDAHFDQTGHWIVSQSPVSPERFLESAQTISLISKCVEKLPLAQKMAFTLKEIEDEVTDTICKILDVSTTHLGVLLFRARNQLRECLDRKSR